MPDYLHMAPVLHGTSACASSAFTSPTTNKIGAMGAMVPAYFSMTRSDCFAFYFRGDYWSGHHKNSQLAIDPATGTIAIRLFIRLNENES